MPSVRVVRWLVATIVASVTLAVPATAQVTQPPLGLTGCRGEQLVVVCDGLVPSWDGVPLDTSLVLPDAVSTRLPLVVLIHGFGNSKQEYLNPDETAYTGNAYTWARRGYAVLTYTARGLWGSCGTPESRAANPGPCARGWIHLASVRHEVRDTQELVGRLVDAGVADPARIGVTGDSYGGGQSAMLAALRDRVVLEDGRIVPWRSPKGTPIKLAAAAPVIPWTSLLEAIAPNGRDAPTPVGVFKLSVANAIFAAAQIATGPGQPAGQPFVPGRPEGYVAPLGADPTADVPRWVARADRGEPYGGADDDAIIGELQRYHSAMGVPSTSAPPPLFVASGFTDDLFPVTEGLRLIERTRREHPEVPTTALLGDFGHQRAANKTADRKLLIDQIAAWFDRYVRGGGPTPPQAVTATTQTCPKDRPSEGPFTAPTLEQLADETQTFPLPGAQTVQSGSGDPDTGRALDPVAGGGDGCVQTATAKAPGTATYELPAAPQSGWLMLGAPRVTAKLAVSGAEPEVTQLAARLWDVAPDGSSQRLVARQLYRPSGSGRESFRLFANGWRFEAGHRPKLELLGADAPFGRPSNASFSIAVSDLSLGLPLRTRVASAPAVRCASKRRFRIHVRRALRQVRVHVDGRRVRVRRHVALVDLRGKPRKTVTVVITGRTKRGRRVAEVRRYRTCRPDPNRRNR